MEPCKMKNCDKPWEEHGEFEKFLHEKRSDEEKTGCRCNIIHRHFNCPVHDPRSMERITEG